jgi:hypothetical protein
VENLILVPRIMGESLDIHPLVVFIAMLAGGILAGFFGVLLASPVAATMRLFGGYFYSKVVEVAPPQTEVVKPSETRDYFGSISVWINRLRDRYRETMGDGEDKGSE